MTLWECYGDIGFHVVRNAEGQYSLWPVPLAEPAGWERVYGPASQAACLAEIEAQWTDTRPASVTAGGNSSPCQAPTPVPQETPVLTPVLCGPAEPRPELPVHLLIEAADLPSGAVAMRCGGRTRTRAELLRLARAWATVLAAEGCGPEIPVAVLIPRGLDAITAIFAVLWAGGAYLPLSAADPDDRLRAILGDCGQPLVLVADELAGRLSDYPGRLIRLSDLRGRATEASLPGASVPMDGLAFIVYTSGTSGRPKGVEGTHGQLTNYALWCQRTFRHQPGEWTVLSAPLAFLGSLTSIFTPLLAGWPIEIAPEGATVDDLLALLAGTRAGLLKLTPTHLRMMLARRAAGTSLARQYMVGSEPLIMTPELAGWLRAEPGAAFANHYGLTETHGCFCHWFGPDAPVGENVPIGIPIANVRAYIVGPDGNDVAPGEVGELLVAGASIGRGYHGNPMLTALRWLPDRYGGPGERALRTGDLARLRPDGLVEIIGRADRQVKVRGHRVEPAAVEHALRSLPGVAEALVLPSYEEGVTSLAAYLVPEPGARLEVAAVHRALSARLPEPSVPGLMAILATFPVNANGKLDVSALPPPGPIEGTAGDGDGQWDRFDLVVADSYREVLGVTSVGLADDFFALGGDSLRAVAVAVAIADRTGCADVPVPTPENGQVRHYSRIVAAVAAEHMDVA